MPITSADMNPTRIILLISLGIILGLAKPAAQCPITVNAGPDQFVCSVGGTATLLGSVTGTALGYNWTPTTGLSNPNILTPSVTVTGPATYTLSAQAIDPSAPNLVTNPAFELGNSGFTSQYSYNALPITPGTYVLTTSPALVLSTFPPCDDHTFGNGTGNMMLVNGNASTGAQVWCQTIPVAQNTWYVMSAWAMCSPLFPPIMQFSVNGNLVGDPYPVATGTCNWQQFSASWYSGSATSAQLCITDQISGGNGFLGDDYALDDIFFAAACTVTDQVDVGIVTVNANSPATAVLPCNAVQTGIPLSGSGSSTGPGYTYQWNGPGVIGGGNSINATVNQEGLYTLTVSYDSGNGICTDESNTLVLPDPNVVVAAAMTTESITCVNPTASLDGTGSSVGNTISYNWQPAAGVASGQGTLNVEVNQLGLYTLTVTNSISGCTATATVFVNQDLALPTAVAAAPTPLSCTVFETTLNGNGSSTGNNFSYLWTGTGIVAGDNTLNNCTVNLPGTYTLTVTNNDNGCTATASATVTATATPPTANASASGNLNCLSPTANLSSTGSSTGPSISYGWTTIGGHFTGSSNGPTATVDSAGVYILTITNSTNGCTAADTVSVAANFALPVAAIASPIPVLNCTVDSVQLNALQSSSGSGFGLVWAAQNGGTFLSGQNGLTPWVGSAGTYLLTISNNANGCTASASATVIENNAPPIAQAGPNATLDCVGNALDLDGTGSSTGAGITYQWTTTGGNILSGDTTLSPSVNGVGVYYLLVENTVNGCATLDSVTVGQDANAPIVQIAQPGQLDCNIDTIMLDATGSSSGANIMVTWTGPGFANGQNGYSPTVNAPGVYALTLLNTSNNCEATASVSVLIDTVPPIADAGLPPNLDFCVASANLDGGLSSQGPNFSYVWSNGDTTLTATVTVAGTYFFTVTNSDNGCSATDSVVVGAFAELPTLDIAPPANLDCANGQIQLSATASVGPEFQYQWAFTGSGAGIVSGGTTLSPTVASPGTYILYVTNTSSDCVAYDSVLVQQTGNLPTAEAGNPQTMQCGQTSLQLDGSGSSSGVSYLWTTQNGNILSGDDTALPIVNAPGIYTLTVTYLQNGCSASDDVTVGQDANAPIADAGPPQTLDCNTLSVELDGTGSSTGPGITYLWTTVDGTISQGANTLTPTVTDPGTYLLTVTNTLNNCQSLSSVQVILDNEQPDAIATVTQHLGCTFDIASIDATGSSMGAIFTYQWTGPGNITGGNSLMPTVDAPGTYTFMVTNTVNACVTFAQVVVNLNLTPPIAVALAPQPLTCANQQVSLSGTGSSTGATIVYQWQGPGILNGGTTLSPDVSEPGIYTITVTNQSSGCTASASVNLTENTTPPTAAAAAPQHLDCIHLQVALSGTGSSTGANFSYQWQGPGIVSGGTSLSPTVDEPGQYTLTVTDQNNGCTATATCDLLQLASQPIAVANAGLPLSCAQLTTSMDGNGSSVGAGILYQWQGPGILGNSSGLNITVNLPGIYTLTVTNQSNGCTATAQATIAQNVALPTVDAGTATALICGQTSTVLQGSTNAVNFTSNWDTPNGNVVSGGQTLSPTVDAPGVYFLVVNDLDNGCSAVDSVEVTEQSVIFPDPNVVGPFCADTLGDILFTGGEGGALPYGYSIVSGPISNPAALLFDLPIGDYEIYVVDANGCDTIFEVTIAEAVPLDLAIDPTVTMMAGDSVQFNPVLNIPVSEVATINWSPSTGLSCTDCLQPTASPASSTVYTLTITSVDDCIATATVALTVEEVVVGQPGVLFVPNAISLNGDGINDVLAVFANEKEVLKIVSFRVFDRWGEAVYTGFDLKINDANEGWDGSFRGKEVGAGVYVWFVEVEMATGGKRLFKGDVVVFK